LLSQDESNVKSICFVIVLASDSYVFLR